MIKFKKISIRNFLSFGDDEQTYEFKKTSGLVLILGNNFLIDKNNKTLLQLQQEYNNEEEQREEKSNSNGAGKSAFLNAIFWCLFGETDRNIKSNFVINYYTKKNCCVILEFEKDGNNYRIERYREHYKFKNSLKLFCNNRDITCNSNNLTQELINQLIGNKDVFLNAVLYSQEKIVKFLRLTPNQRIDVISNILNLKMLETLEKRIKERSKQNEEELISKKLQIKEINASIEVKKNNIEYTIKSKENIIKQYQNKIDEIKKILNSLQIDDTKIEEIKNKKKELENLKQEYDIIEKKIYEKKQLLKDYIDLCKKEKKEKKKFKKIEKEIIEVKQNPTRCPVCNNYINTEKLSEYIQNKQKECNVIKEEIIFIKNKKHEIKKQIKENYIQYNKNRLNLIKENISIILKDLSSFSSIIQIEKIDSISNEREKLLAEINNYNSLIENLKKEKEEYIQKLKEEIEKEKQYCQIYEKDYELISRKQSVLDFWIKAFNAQNVYNIRNYIISSIIPIINWRLQYYVISIFDYKVEIYFNSSFEEKIILKDKEIYYENLSGGEKKRIDLAINLALFDLLRGSYNSTILFFDEVFDQLDDEGKKKFINISQEISKNQLVFLITHDNTIKKDYVNIFDEIITIEKINGFSYIKCENKN